MLNALLLTLEEEKKYQMQQRTKYQKRMYQVEMLKVISLKAWLLRLPKKLRSSKK